MVQRTANLSQNTPRPGLYSFKGYFSGFFSLYMDGVLRFCENCETSLKYSTLGLQLTRVNFLKILHLLISVLY